jgi:hypothetical protein
MNKVGESYDIDSFTQALDLQISWFIAKDTDSLIIFPYSGIVYT